MTSEIPPIEPATVFPARVYAMSARDQANIHKHSGVEVDETDADPVLLVASAVQVIGKSILAHHPGFGPVITNQVITVKALDSIGVEARIEGSVIHFEETPRGILFTSLFSIQNGSGVDLAELRANVLLIDPTKPPPRSKAGKQHIGEAKPPEPQVREVLGSFTFSPDATLAFDLDYAGRSLHSNMEIANSAGFPKPIVAGNQVFDIVWNRYIKEQFTLPVVLDFTLKRPIFWDEEVQFVRSGDTTIDVLSAAGKLAISCKVEGTARQR